MGHWKSMRRISQCQNYYMKSRLSVNITTSSSFHSSQASFSYEDLHTLGLGENATKDEIKAAYFSKAKQFHPDSSSSGKTGSAEFQKLNEAYKRLMYESKFTSENSKFYQDPWGRRYDKQNPYGQNPRSYRNPDPRNYSHGAQNPWNESYNDHRDPRSYRSGPQNPWTDPWERMHRRNGTEERKISEQEKDILRRVFLRLFIGLLFVQYFIYHVNMANHQNSYRSGCQCAKCVEMTRIEEEKAIYRTVY